MCKNHFRHTKKIGLVSCLVLIFLFPADFLSAAQLVSVTIQGIEGRLYDNVASSLKINLRKDEEDLTSRQIKSLHKNAEKEIRQGLEPFGYYSPIILAQLVAEEGVWRATYTIDPGEPVVVSELTVEIVGDDTSVAKQQLIEAFPLQVGEILDHAVYTNGKKKLLQQFYTKGYMEAKYKKSEIRVTVAEKKASLNFIIETGPGYLFGETVFDQDILDAKLLNRYINFRKGEPYSLKKLLQLQQILYKTNFFSQVAVQGDFGSVENLHIPVVIRLAEPEFVNRYSFGAGYATDDGLRGTLGWDNRLLNRYGHSLSAKVKYAQRRESFEFIYGVPIADPRDDKLLFGASYNDESWKDTDTRYLRGGVSFEHAGRRVKYSGGVELRNEEFEVGDNQGESFLAMPHLGWSLAYGDDLVNTTHGLFLSVNLRTAWDNVFSDVSFIQSVASGKLITTPFTHWRIIAKGSLGGTKVDEFADLPPSLRFYAGGDQSVRGYSYRELASTDDAGTVIGGKYLVFGSLEVERIITDNWSAAVFLDAGKGINDFSEDLSKGAGVGLRYRLPFGQIRLDVASALSEEDRPIRLHITVGGDL